MHSVIVFCVVGLLAEVQGASLRFEPSYNDGARTKATWEKRAGPAKLKLDRSNMPPKRTSWPDVTLPKEFDARKRWPQCPSIGEIHDEGDCRGSYAVSVADAITDRICIATNKTVRISVEDLMSCPSAAEGCEGQNTYGLWDYYVEHGVVTGGYYNSSEGCRPYSHHPCMHVDFRPHPVRNSKLPNCSNFNFPEPSMVCQLSCRPGYNKTKEQDRHFGEKSFAMRGSLNMMREIYHYGPVTSKMIVYRDFAEYKNGIYRTKDFRRTTGITIRILGWGEEDGEYYWLAANSWNTHWGMKGFFKIRRGFNECGIEEFCFVGRVKEK